MTDPDPLVKSHPRPDPVFVKGVYEGAGPFDDVYTRMIDAMLDTTTRANPWRPGITHGMPVSEAMVLLDAALKVLQPRVYEAIRHLDHIQDHTDQEGGRESAWLYNREEVEDLLGLPNGPYYWDCECDQYPYE